MPTYNVKGNTVIEWELQIDAPDEDEACERACDEADQALDAGELEYKSKSTEAVSLDDVTDDCRADG